MAERRNWTEQEVRAALALYLVTPFGRIHKGNPQIIDLAGRIGRTPSAVALKLSNLAAIDETLPRKGMANASALDRQIWAEFQTEPEYVLDAREFVYRQPDAVPDGIHLREGVDRVTTTKVRQGQGYFRDMMLASYGAKCALTGVEEPKLLVASHIVGWAEDASQRLNPRNGILLNALHDKAFDRHLITFDESYRMIVSDHMRPITRERIGRGVLDMPSRFLPDQDLLERHRAKFFDAQASHP
ncbi:HNH endonuclease [Amylibacter sp. IMCC11727]|uniref:HNH endonuclease n=1 Tax=Amylibacter sp. IMCC11727 TaxID=3039851 RepID=UPI00244E1234|nr:HNH endonuclease [Amylibacter sp. IMCC11727]WGI21688.1 HNH endonuclease [Amylibacter sp. IMCC11727]